MTTQEFLQSEQGALKQFLGQPLDAIERASLTSRLEEIDAELAAAGPAPPEPAKATLTFRGKPVVGHLGVSAEFGSQAARLFADTVATAVSGSFGPLAPMGRVPQREQGDLLITGTATGSFGFDFVEHHVPRSDDESPVAASLRDIRVLLESTKESDEALADATEKVDRRAIDAVRKFLALLTKYEAYCALDTGGKIFRFPSVDAVRASFDRLNMNNWHEETAKIKGMFTGALPDGRRFEFRRQMDGTVVKGRVADTVDPDKINKHLREPTEISVLVTRVGRGRPRFVLMDLPEEW